MKYALAVEVKLIEIEEAPELPDFSTMTKPGGDPMAVAVGVMGSIGPMLHPKPPRFFGNAAGFDFRKETEISVTNFAALAAIIGRFDELVTDIEHEKLQV